MHVHCSVRKGSEALLVSHLEGIVCISVVFFHNRKTSEDVQVQSAHRLKADYTCKEDRTKDKGKAKPEYRGYQTVHQS